MASIQKKTAGSGIAVEGLNDVIFGLRGMERAAEVRKELRGFHKDLAKEVESKARAEALRQKTDGGSVPKRTLGSRGYVGNGTDRSAFLDVRKTNKFVRNLEFGRKYQFIPNLVVGRAVDRPSSAISKTQRGAVARPQGQGGIKGSYYPASKMKRRVYKEWVGDFWTRQGGFPEGTKYGGYVAEKTIARIVPGLSAEYADEMFAIVKKAIKGK
jgi:hypothetical protein|tara:strand:- start:1172 stop:1810 length:639 start_codon:yes stop_codon:yes gene_type:complete